MSNKFGLNDKILIRRNPKRRGVVLRVRQGNYYIRWDNNRNPINYAFPVIDAACELVDDLKDSDPNILFKRRKE